MYLTYDNITWRITYFSRLKAIRYQQKHAARDTFNRNILRHSRTRLSSPIVLNIYQMNLYQHLNFMYKFKNEQTLKIFDDIIKRSVHQYPTQFLKDNFSVKTFSLRSTKHSIFIRGLKIWNEFLTHEEKSLQSHKLFSKKNQIFTT